MLIEEQEEVIAMLERLRAKKRYVDFFNNYQPSLPRELIENFLKKRLQLRDFSEKVIDTKAAGYIVPAQYQYASGIGGAGIGDRKSTRLNSSH